jgi:hypothetical protein
MHLDILYKTVDFLDQEQIIKNLPDYIEGKRIKIEQENKRIIDTNKKAILKPGTAPKKNDETIQPKETVNKEDTTVKSEIKPEQPQGGKSQKKALEKPNPQ